MKITAVIAEYNPFHNGHLYHLEQTRQQTNADYILVVMSGDFVQRGAPAICNKYVRTRMALSCGADAVIELPSLFALSSAEYFAGGGITLLNELGAVDAISFGAENDSVSLFTSVAKELLTCSPEVKHNLSVQLKTGISYPTARLNAFHCLSCQKIATEELNMLFSAPNNILGLEYCKALLSTHSTIQPFILKRAGAYHATSLSEQDSHYSSASAIRSALTSHNQQVTNHIPTIITPIFEQALLQNQPIYSNDFSDLLQYKLFSEANIGFIKYLDCNRDISNKICNSLSAFTTIDDFCLRLKSKNLTYTRLSRVLFHILLNITAPKHFSFDVTERKLLVPYARLLGFRQNSSKMLSKIKKNSSIPLITKLADAKDILSPEAYSMLLQDIFCSNIYESVSSRKNGCPPLNEFLCSPIVF